MAFSKIHRGTLFIVITPKTLLAHTVRKVIPYP